MDIRIYFIIFNFICLITPHTYLESIDLLEKVQSSFTRRLPRLDNLNYTEKVTFLNLPSLELHKLRIVCNLMYNIMHS